jgi:hypothetical protein
MDKNRLAAAGFYYTGRGDIVRCAFCGVEVGWWQEGDSQFDNHKRFSPSCGFDKGFVLEIFLLASLKHLKNLPVVKRCADVDSRALLLEIILLTSLNQPVVKMCADHSSR